LLLNCLCRWCYLLLLLLLPLLLLLLFLPVSLRGPAVVLAAATREWNGIPSAERGGGRKGMIGCF